MRELHLFAGIGGGILGGILLGHSCVCAVELDGYCQRVLRARQSEGVLESFPIYDDIRTFDARPWRGRVDVVCGGFPCQPWSVAGKRKGAADERHLWPEMARVVAECRPAFVFAENVSLAAFAEPWRDLRGMGYRVPPALCLAASDVGAPHIRKRWWLLAADADCQQHEGAARSHQWATAEGLPDVADAEGIGRGARRPEPEREQGRSGVAGGGRSVADADRLRQLQPQGGERHERGRSSNGGEEVADASRPRLEGRRASGRTATQHARLGSGWWATEPRVGRVAHGVPDRVGQLKALGNAQVPAVAAAAFRMLMAQHYEGGG